MAVASTASPSTSPHSAKPLLEVRTMLPRSYRADTKANRVLACNVVALYAGALPYYDVVLEPMGFAPATQAIRAALQRGDVPGMLDAVTEEMLDALVLAGTPDDVHRQLRPWEGLCDLLLLYCPPSLTMAPAETRANHEAIIAAFAS